jgi:hypothetical protein
LEVIVDRLSDADLDIISYGLEDHIKELEKHGLLANRALYETKELLVRIKEELFKRRGN